MDCGQLVIAVMSEAGLVEAFDLEAYSAQWNLHQGRELYLEQTRQYCDPVAAPWEVGDILIYRVGRCASHGAIYIGENRVVHALGGRQVEIADITGLYFSSRFDSGWRLKWLAR